jgi:hypothetical protein
MKGYVMTTLPHPIKALLGAALLLALLGGCNKRPADQPPSPTAATPDATPPAGSADTAPPASTGTTPANQQQNNPPSGKQQ